MIAQCLLKAFSLEVLLDQRRYKLIPKILERIFFIDVEIKDHEEQVA
jgi:hypothetical protein